MTARDCAHAYAGGMSEPAPELDAEDALRGVVNQLVINGERMPVIIPGSVVETLSFVSALVTRALPAGYLHGVMTQAMPWAEPLPDDELDLLASDIAEAAGAGDHAPERLATVLREWRVTAEAYGDPETLAALTTAPVDCGPVPEPVW